MENGTALSGTNYTAASGTLTIPAKTGLGIDEVKELLDDDESAVRRGAADGLGASGEEADSAVVDLIERLAHDPDCQVRASPRRHLACGAPSSSSPSKNTRPA